MRVGTLGEGEPEIAVVGGIHGDEPCGVRAAERLLADPPDLRRPVKVVVANEAAVERGVRYVEADLNRSFPGDPDGATHEARLAAALAEEVAGLETLALHSTRSQREPFGAVADVGDFERRIVPHLPISVVVDTGEHPQGRLFEVADVVEVECGLQGSDEAVRNAHLVTRAFLAAEGALADPEPAREVAVYRITDSIPKVAPSGSVGEPAADVTGGGPLYEVFAENFTRVPAGEPFAAVDGEPLVAEEPFYPVLLSADGYADIFGYASERAGNLS